jgi:AraC-like DNA-binding protein
VSYFIAKPSHILSQYVKQYWAIEDCLPSGIEHIQRIVPNGLMELMFYLGDKPKSLNDSKQISENTILSGQQKSYYDIVVTGRLSLFSISLQPYAASLLFDMPSCEYFDQNVPVKYILKNKIGELESDIYESSSFEEKVCIVEKFLLNQIRKSRKEYELNRIKNSIFLINQTKGLVSIDALSTSACLSRRQYERVFAEYIGSSPKQFLRTLRFQNTLFEKQLNQKISLTELAYTCGYYDQAHMINDYRLLSGKTPSQYFIECEPYSDYFQ